MCVCVLFSGSLQRQRRLLSSQVCGFEGMIEYLVLPGIPSEDELVVMQNFCTATASTLYTRARHTRAHTYHICERSDSTTYVSIFNADAMQHGQPNELEMAATKIQALARGRRGRRIAQERAHGLEKQGRSVC